MLVLGMSMLSAIYSLFKRFGIVQLLSSAGLGRLGTLKKALKDDDIKELFEALLQTQIKYIDVYILHANKKEKDITTDELSQQQNLFQESNYTVCITVNDTDI